MGSKIYCVSGIFITTASAYIIIFNKDYYAFIPLAIGIIITIDAWINNEK
jgi:hypothetical protein